MRIKAITSCPETRCKGTISAATGRNFCSTDVTGRRGNVMIQYKLPGNRNYQERIYPEPANLDSSTKLNTYEEVIAHFTRSSLDEDDIQIQERSLNVVKGPGESGYFVSFEPLPYYAGRAEQFKQMHIAMLHERHAALPLPGPTASTQTPASNPM